MAPTAPNPDGTDKTTFHCAIAFVGPRPQNMKMQLLSAAREGGCRGELSVAEGTCVWLRVPVPNTELG